MLEITETVTKIPKKATLPNLLNQEIFSKISWYKDLYNRASIKE